MEKHRPKKRGKQKSVIELDIIINYGSMVPRGSMGLVSRWAKFSGPLIATYLLLLLFTRFFSSDISFIIFHL